MAIVNAVTATITAAVTNVVTTVTITVTTNAVASLHVMRSLKSRKRQLHSKIVNLASLSKIAATSSVMSRSNAKSKHHLSWQKKAYS